MTKGCLEELRPLSVFQSRAPSPGSTEDLDLYQARMAEGSIHSITRGILENEAYKIHSAAQTTKTSLL